MSDLYSDNPIVRLFQMISSKNVIRFGAKSVMDLIPLIGPWVNNAIDELVPDEWERILKAFKETTEQDIKEIKEIVKLNEIETKLLMKEVEISILRLKLEKVQKPVLEIRDVSVVGDKKIGKRGTSCEINIRIMNYGEKTALIDIEAEFNPIIEFDVPWDSDVPYSYFRDYDPTYDENKRTSNDLKINAGDDINYSPIFVYPRLHYYKWYRGKFILKITLHNPEVKGQTLELEREMYRPDSGFLHHTISLLDEDFVEDGEPIFLEYSKDTVSSE